MIAQDIVRRSGSHVPADNNLFPAEPNSGPSMV